jgi:hypothetical protein
VAKIVDYFDRAHAFADLGLAQAGAADSDHPG